MPIHFFKAHSRLGMINIPHKGTSLNIGVERGPDYVLDEQFIQQFGIPSADAFIFSSPSGIEFASYETVLAEELERFKNLMTTRTAQGEVQVMVGGDHSTAFSSLGATLERFDNKSVGYIQFDSHADLNLFSTSHTGNFHGMFLRPYFGEFDSVPIARQVKLRLAPHQVLYFGNLDLDPYEVNFINDNAISVISSDVRKDIDLEALLEFIRSYAYIHVSFDVDVFDRSIVRATGTAAPNGMSRGEIFPALELLGKSGKIVSIDVVEVNPLKEGADQTVHIAKEVLATLLMPSQEQRANLIRDPRAIVLRHSTIET